MNNICSLLESDKPHPSKLTNATKYQLTLLSSTSVKTTWQSKEQVQSSSIIDFRLQSQFIKRDQTKNQLSSSSRMLQALNIETTQAENYDKLQKH